MIIRGDTHAIFAKEYKDGKFHCVNSWGEIDPEPTVRMEDVTNLYYVGITRLSS